MVGVEPHVLRYWEEELELPIERNSQGKRCYSSRDVEKFQEIKFWKDKGMQLKAVKEILEDPEIAGERRGDRPEVDQAYAVVTVEPTDSAKKLEQLLDGIMARSLEKNNEKLVNAICDVILRELEEQLDRKLEERARTLVEQEMMRQMVDAGVRESAASKEKTPRGLLRRWKQWLEDRMG